MKEKEIIFTAKVLSVLFTPFYLPILGLLILFIFSYLSLLPLTYKLFLLLMFYLFTVFLPTALIRFYRRYQGWTLIELGSRERRAIPYVISIFSYLLCYYIMAATHVPHFMGSILIAALVIQVACAIINLFHQDIHPYGSHRRRYRCVAGFFSYIFVQSGVVALYCAAACRHGRHEPHDSASAFSAPGGVGLSGRRGMLVCVCAAVLSSASLCLRRSVLWPQAVKVSTR